MDEIKGFMQSPAWWFSAVFVAIVVNLVSAHLGDGTAWVLRHVTRRLKAIGDAVDEHGKKVSASNEEFMKRLLNEEHLRRFLVEAEVRARLMSIELFVVGLACAGVGHYVVSSPQPFLPSQVGITIGAFSVLVVFTSLRQFAFAHALCGVLLKVERARNTDLLVKG